MLVVLKDETHFFEVLEGVAWRYSHLGPVHIEIATNFPKEVVLRQVSILDQSGRTFEWNSQVTFKGSIIFVKEFLRVNLRKDASISFILTDLDGNSIYREGEDYHIRLYALKGDEEYGDYDILDADYRENARLDPPTYLLNLGRIRNLGEERVRPEVLPTIRAQELAEMSQRLAPFRFDGTGRWIDHGVLETDVPPAKRD
jgi:hypothetical protein